MEPLLPAIVRRPLTRACLRDTRYLIVAFVTGTLGFTFIVSAISTAAGLSILIIGLPTAVLFVRCDRWWCQFERSRAAAVLQRQIPARYAPASGEGRIRRWLSVLADRQNWFDALWMFVAFPVCVVGFVVVVTVWVVVATLLTLPIYAWSLPGWVAQHVVLYSIAGPFVAIAAAVIGAWLMHGVVLAHASLAAVTLGHGRAEVLEQRVQALSETRAGAVDAATTELARVERDLHDGAQARLVALAMDLGMAEQRLAQADPETAREHVANARGQARAAMAELRDLVRGIGPSVLHDRGLDAALTALVAGRSPPVDLRVDLPARDAGARETAAYFVAAEALANARKHAAASRISIGVWEDAGGRLVVEVVDDGVGGADAGAGSGLAGLRKRVAALDGTLAVASPSGGPTTVRAELPCAS
jgi:signal transduction histidine kinase